MSWQQIALILGFFYSAGFVAAIFAFVLAWKGKL